jgi:glycosyltransferase involved in cell wall biosynthesis
VETGLLGGLGLSAYYYPYLPVGAIRQKLDMICRQRLEADQDPGLFLMLGSAGHHTVREAFAWFVQNAQAYGVPEGIRVLVGGSKTDELLPAGSSVPGLELQGWLEQSDLDRLLLQARGVLAPQQRGFGALTRLSELACAGLPVITSRHPTYALDPTPGLHIADDDWQSWCQQMVQLNRNETHLSTTDYKAWEESQPKPLGMVVKRLLKL